MTTREVYFDNNSTCKVDPRTIECLGVVAETYFANPSTSYPPGRKARCIIEASRGYLSTSIGVKLSQLFFCASASEANNIVCRGRVINRSRGKRPHVILSAVEHASVYKTVLDLELHGLCTKSLVRVDKNGFMDLTDLERQLRAHPNTVLVAFIVGHNELGTYQDPRPITRICARHGAHSHGDITQIMGKYVIDVRAMGLDSAAFSSHKFFCPRGVGGLFLCNPKSVDTCQTGGGQEQGVRASTESTALIYAMAMGHRYAMESLPSKRRHVEGMRDYLQRELCKMFGKDTVVNGGDLPPDRRLYNTLSISIPCHDNVAIMRRLHHEYGIYLNVGSACNKEKRSRVLSQIGLSKKQEKGTFRISLSWMNTRQECEYFLRCMRELKPLFKEKGTGKDHNATACSSFIDVQRLIRPLLS